jgi:uncharacterized protein (TIGR02757 family)
LNNQKLLKEKLDYHFKYFDKYKISPDPLEFLHLYTNENDIEISGIISSVFAYGNVKQIIRSLEIIHKIMNHKPYEFVENYSVGKGRQLFQNMKHRFYTSDDIVALFSILQKSYKRYGSLKNLFYKCYFGNDKDLKTAISVFANEMINYFGKGNNVSSGIKFMFPDPIKGSACKRMNLFLRWMVRKDELDFGFWNKIPTSELIIPVDTHVAKICKKLNLTKRNNVSWKMAEEITEKLKTFDPIDPVKYDFAICHIGMRRLTF